MIQWIVTSSILIIVVAALRFLLRGKISLRLQYALWALVLVRLLVPVSFGGTSLSVMNAVPESLRVSDGYIRQSLDYQLNVEGEPVYRGDTPPSGEVFDGLTEGKSYSVGSHTRKTSIELFWYAGMLCVGVCLLASNLRFAARLRRSRRALHVEGCALPVYVSEIIDTPCLFGVLRPTIYVTPSVAENETVLRHSIEHEATHFRHADHIWALLRGVCLALHWYNPLVWLAAVLSRRDAELACDEATIKRIGENERAEYGRTLIEMTCQKRPALLLTATTMTGSKRGLKERITLIAKKPKMAIYTLVAVVLIAAVSAGCTFTGAANDKDKPWTWTQNLRAEDIASATAWYGGADAGPTLAGNDISELISLLNSLNKEDFTENAQSAGITPEYGLALECEGVSCFINQADAPSGSLEISYGDKQWWIDSEGLHSFILALAENDEQASNLDEPLEPVFTRLDEVSSIAVRDPFGEPQIVAVECFDEMLEWVSAFTIGKEQKDTDVPEPGTNSYSVILTYADDSTDSSGIDITVRDGIPYYIVRPDLPECWYELWDSDEQASSVEIEVDTLIINALGSDGAYAEAALDTLIDSLMENPVETLEAMGAREAGVADFLCWSLANRIRGMALDTSDALSSEGLSESGLYARELILTYFEDDTPAPKSWRMVYLDFFDNALPALSEDRIVAVGLFDTHFDGVPELAVWYEASTDGVLYYTDGKEVYQNKENIYEGEPPEGVLRAQEVERIEHDAMNAFLNSWR